jgi:hypothetical protein
MPRGVIVSSVTREDSLREVRPTREHLPRFAPLPANFTVRLDAGDAAVVTRETLAQLGDQGEITLTGTRIARRWVIARTNAWHTRGCGKRAVWTARRVIVSEAPSAFATTISVLRRRAAQTVPSAQARGCHQSPIRVSS